MSVGVHSPRDDAWTIAAVAVVAACLSVLAHEAFGHGGYCVLSGGRIIQLTTVYFDCRPVPRLLGAAGPIGNLVWAAMAWTALRFVPADQARLRLLLALTMSFSVFWEAGYMLSAAVLKEGDYIFALFDLFGRVMPAHRTALFAAGLALYGVGVLLCRAAFGAFANAPGRAARLLRLSWLSAAIALAFAAALYAPNRLASLRQGALEVGAASWPMLWMGARLSTPVSPGAPPVGRSRLWIWSGALLYLALAYTLGRGITAAP